MSRKIKRLERVPPRASVLIESMRDVGYSLQTAVADIIDNSLTAGAKRIELLTDTESDNPSIGIIDDGVGMSEQELLEAMRPGTKSPLETRDSSDLGRFGLGLKTASFSQCRRLTVATQKDEQMSCAVWDLDTVAEKDDWYVEIPDDNSIIPWVGRLSDEGTLVVWENLDRLLENPSGPDRQDLIRQIDETATHIAFVFHRFLSGNIARRKRVTILLNGRELESFDPFHSNHLATQRDPCEIFQFKGEKIRIQAFTLPHHSKVKDSEWNKYGRSEGYVKNQGFYLYRNHRLIVHGTWFGLARQSELTKLSRVQIDISNRLDAHWKIDVKKASAQLPPAVRKRLRQIIERISGTSKKVYTHKGTKLTRNSSLPVWERLQNKNQIKYTLSVEHPAFKFFIRNLESGNTQEFLNLLELIASTLPVDSLFADIGEAADSVDQRLCDPDQLAGLVNSTYLQLRENGLSDSEIKNMMSAAEPFCLNWAEANTIIETLESRDGYE